MDDRASHGAGHCDNEGTDITNTPLVQLRGQEAIAGPPACGRYARPRTLPRLVLMLEHCGELANLLHTYQLAATHIRNSDMSSHTEGHD